MKHFRAWDQQGLTFGMDIDATSKSYKAMKKSITPKTIIGRWNTLVNVLVVPWNLVAAMMGQAGWLFAERQEFKKIQIDDGEDIYIEYPDGIHI